VPGSCLGRETGFLFGYAPGFRFGRETGFLFGYAPGFCLGRETGFLFSAYGSDRIRYGPLTFCLHGGQFFRGRPPGYGAAGAHPHGSGDHNAERQNRSRIAPSFHEELLSPELALCIQ
jgi:hypothetical protein